MGWMTPEFQKLQQASLDGDLDTVRSLLDAGVDLNADFGAPRGWSPLMGAAHRGHLAIVRLLVERGAKLDAVEIDRWGTALDLALDADQTEVATYLKSVGTPKGTQIPNPYRDGRLGGWADPIFDTPE